MENSLTSERASHPTRGVVSELDSRQVNRTAYALWGDSQWPRDTCDRVHPAQSPIEDRSPLQRNRVRNHEGSLVKLEELRLACIHL